MGQSHFDAFLPNLIPSVDLIPQRQALIDARDRDGMAALGWSCLKGRVQATQCLLDQGSDLNGPDKKGRSPLFLAAYKGDPEVVQVGRKDG